MVGSPSVATRALAVSAPDPDPSDARLLLPFQDGSSRDQFGSSIANAGDVNGDGHADLVVGASSFAFGDGLSAGSVYVYWGASFGTNLPDIVLHGTQIGEMFGSSVASTYRDGFGLLLVGAPFGGLQQRGRVYLYQDLSLGLSPRVINAPLSDRGFGVSVAACGDVNGDGGGDFIVGAPGLEGDGQNRGHAYVYYGSISPRLTLVGSGLNDHFGAAVASAGDFNGDGYPDFIVGETVGGSTGRASLYYGGPGIDAVPDQILGGELAGDRFGAALASLGDVNADGYDDLAISAPWNDAGGPDAGRVYVFFGGPGADNSADLVLTGEHAQDHFGQSLASAGDMNSDGYPDVIVGAPAGAAGDSVGPGRAYVYFGGPLLDATPDLVLDGEANGDHFGASVAALGDFNDDGGSDVMVGAPSNDFAGSDAGRSYLFTTWSHPPVVRAPSTVVAGTRLFLDLAVSVADAEGDPIASLTAGPIPYGATFTVSSGNRSGRLQWTPTDIQIGTYDVTFTAANLESASATTRIQVVFHNSPPALNPFDPVTALEGSVSEEVLSGYDQDGDPLAFQLIGGPPFATVAPIDNSSALLRLAPGYGDAGAYAATVQIDDGHGGTASALIAIAVEHVNRGPVASAGGPYSGVIHVPIAFDGTGSSDPDGSPLACRWDFGDLSSGTGAAVSHAYSAGGVFAVVLTVSDGSLSGQASTTATVQDVFPARAFVEQPNRIIRLVSARAAWCAEVEPAENSFAITSVLPSAVVLRYGDRQIVAISDRVTIGADRDANGVGEMTVCFTKTDLRTLFLGLPKGTITVSVTLEGGLSTGGMFRAVLPVEVASSGGALTATLSPNPLNPSGVLTFTTSRPGRVRVTVFDLRGRLLRTLLPAQDLGPGYHDLLLDGRGDRGESLSSGAYFYRIEAPDGVASGRFVLLK